MWRPSLDRVAEIIASLGVPGLIFTIIAASSGLTGAAAITFTLSAFGPGGMLGGLISFGIVGLVCFYTTKYGGQAVIKAVVKKLQDRGQSRDEIWVQVQAYPVSNDLKNQVYRQLFDEGVP